MKIYTLKRALTIGLAVAAFAAGAQDTHHFDALHVIQSAQVGTYSPQLQPPVPVQAVTQPRAAPASYERRERVRHYLPRRYDRLRCYRPKRHPKIIVCVHRRDGE